MSVSHNPKVIKNFQSQLSTHRKNSHKVQLVNQIVINFEKSSIDFVQRILGIKKKVKISQNEFFMIY